MITKTIHIVNSQSDEVEYAYQTATEARHAMVKLLGELDNDVPDEFYLETHGNVWVIKRINYDLDRIYWLSTVELVVG